MIFCNAITGFIAKWCLWNKCRNCILMTCQYPDLVVLLIGWSKLSANQTYRYYQDLGSERSPVWFIFSPHFPDVILQGNQLWLREMVAVFSGCYKKGWKWLHKCIFNSLYNLHPSLVQWNPAYGYLSNMITSLLWPLFLRAIHFLLKKPPLMWPPVNMANGHVLKSQTMESIIISPH